MGQAFDAALFRRWLQANSRHGPLLTTIPIRYAEFGNDPSQPIVANGILLGTQSEQARERDRAYIDAASGDKIEALKHAPATGCSMLLTLAREKSGYDAQNPGQPDGELKFTRYIDQIVVCPIFRKDIDDRVTNGFQGNWPEVINAIVGYYDGVSSSDRDLLYRSLTAVAQAASSSPSTIERVCIFFQSTIDAGNGISTFFYYMDVRMVTYVEQGGKNEPDRVHNQASLALHRVKMGFHAEEWPAQAEAVYREIQSSLEDWLATNSTPIGSLPSDWHPR